MISYEELAWIWLATGAFSMLVFAFSVGYISEEEEDELYYYGACALFMITGPLALGISLMVLITSLLDD